VTTTVFAVDDPVQGVDCHPATCRIGLLGVGNVGSAFARLARDASASFAARGFSPIISASLVRDVRRTRDAHLAAPPTDDHDFFFAEPIDVVVEALGGVEPAFTLVRRALDRGIPVVTANKSLIAAHGEELAQLARRRGTALRFEAACIAGVPFLGTFERRALVSRASGVTAILNGTSNYILTAMTRGGSFEAALADAQRLGYAEPDPSMDISGADAAEKLTILIRLFGRLIVDPATIPLDTLSSVEADDIAAAAAFDGALRPVSRASWDGTAIRAHVGPAFLGGTHPLARVSASPTASSSTPNAARSATSARRRPGRHRGDAAGRRGGDGDGAARADADATRCRRGVGVTPDSGWFVRLDGAASHVRRRRPARLVRHLVHAHRAPRRSVYALTCQREPARIHGALDALQAATGVAARRSPRSRGQS
jgi:homoserine dehydrogenase